MAKSDGINAFFDRLEEWIGFSSWIRFGGMDLDRHSWRTKFKVIALNIFLQTDEQMLMNSREKSLMKIWGGPNPTDFDPLAKNGLFAISRAHQQNFSMKFQV